MSKSSIMVKKSIIIIYQVIKKNIMELEIRLKLIVIFCLYVGLLIKNTELKIMLTNFFYKQLRILHFTMTKLIIILKTQIYNYSHHPNKRLMTRVISKV